MALSDFDLRAYIEKGRLKIENFHPDIIRENGIDFRLNNEFAVLKDTDKTFDLRNPPKELSEFYIHQKADSFVIQRRETVLVSTIEYIKMPDDLMGQCNLRSTWARLGISIAPTIIDASWEGRLTIALHATRFPVRIFKGDRFLHAIFNKLTSPVQQRYSGKYQGQKVIALPISDPIPKQ